MIELFGGVNLAMMSAAQIAANRPLSMFIVMQAALLIPILMARFHITSVPTAVAEIVVGILLGQSGLGIVGQSGDMTLLSSLGVIILMFLSGMEIDFSLFTQQPVAKKGAPKTPVQLAVMAFGGNLVVAGGLAWGLKVAGLFKDFFLATLLFMTIALGVVIATLKEKEILSKPIGQTILLTAVLGELFPMVMLTIYASLNGGDAEKIWLIVLPLVVAIVLLYRFRQPFIWFNQITKATTQVDIRLAFFLIFTLVMVAETVGAENILGAFLAGMVMKLLEPHASTQDKLTSIGYGFFIPIFFIMTGVKLNLRELLTNRAALLLIPVLVACFVVAKLGTALIYRQRFSARNALAGSFLTATTITLVLPALQVARNLGAITPTQSDAFILAAVIVCVLGPVAFNSIFRPAPEDRVKQRVVFIGANVLTVPIAQQLTQNWYQIRMVTDREDNYHTYDSEVKHLAYLPQITPQALAAGDYFQTDILVVGFANENRNAELALAAKQAGVARVIANESFQHADDLIKQLREAGVEIFNSYNAQASVLRALVESPAIMQMLTGTEAGLFEVRVQNRKYTGRQLMDLPFINEITVSRIRRGKTWLTPHGTTIIEPGDRLIFTAKDLDQVAQIRGELRRQN